MTTNRELLQQSYANQQAKGWKTITPLLFGTLASVYLLNGFPNLQGLFKAAPALGSAGFVALSYKTQKDKVNKALNDPDWVLKQLSKDKEMRELLLQVDLDASIDSTGNAKSTGSTPKNKRPTSQAKASSILAGNTTRNSEVPVKMM